MLTQSVVAVTAAVEKGGTLNEGEKGREGGGRSEGRGEAATEIASEEAVGRCVEDVEKLLFAAPAPPALMRLLSDMGVAVPLFRLHCFCKT